MPKNQIEVLSMQVGSPSINAEAPQVKGEAPQIQASAPEVKGDAVQLGVPAIDPALINIELHSEGKVSAEGKVQSNQPNVQHTSNID
jgi:hypothetical protein